MLSDLSKVRLPFVFNEWRFLFTSCTLVSFEKCLKGKIILVVLFFRTATFHD
eukprot:c30148_g1_i1 orf=2-154(-)